MGELTYMKEILPFSNNNIVLPKWIGEIWEHSDIVLKSDGTNKSGQAATEILNKSPGRPDLFGRENKGEC